MIDEEFKEKLKALCLSIDKDYPDYPDPVNEGQDVYKYYLTKINYPDKESELEDYEVKLDEIDRIKEDEWKRKVGLIK